MGSNSNFSLIVCSAIAIFIASSWYITDILYDVDSSSSERSTNFDKYYEKTNEFESSLPLEEVEHDSGDDLIKNDIGEKQQYHDSSDAKDDDTNSPSEFTCAPWIPIENRKILMVSALKRFVTWEDHLQGVIKGGESYWSACMDYVLRELGFEVTVELKELDPIGETMQKLERGEIHRMIADSSSGANFVRSIWAMPELLCKVRMMVWWPDPEKRPRN